MLVGDTKISGFMAHAVTFCWSCYGASQCDNPLALYFNFWVSRYLKEESKRDRMFALPGHLGSLFITHLISYGDFVYMYYLMYSQCKIELCVVHISFSASSLT